MTDNNDYKLEPAKEGISENNAEDWKKFHNLIFHAFCWKERNNKNKTNKDGKPYINDYVWRGHRCESWDLISYFDREFKKHYGENNNPREYILERHSNSFAYACRNKLGEFGIKMREFLEWTRKDTKRVRHLWALGQHYDLKTPLLDWCYSPFVAAFFAFEEKTIAEDFAEDELRKFFEYLKNGLAAKQLDLKKLKRDFVEELKKRAEKRTVIGLNVKLLKELRKEELGVRTHIRQEDTNPHEHKREIDHTFHFHQRGDQERRHKRQNDDVPTLDYFDPMSSEHTRLISQRGLFTITKNGEAIEEIVRKNWKEGTEPWIVKILIPNDNRAKDNRAEFLRALNLMDINHMTLFPEIYGAAKFCNIGIEDGLNDYAVFHGQGV
jgi:hypothetical protein